jgi:hypothetical protein
MTGRAAAIAAAFGDDAGNPVLGGGFHHRVIQLSLDDPLRTIAGNVNHLRQGSSVSFEQKIDDAGLSAAF